MNNKEKRKNGISPTREEDYAEWYQQVLKSADLAEHSPVRGCMIIKPWGYAIWELMQADLDKRFKKTGHKNAYFPLFIPLSYLQKEAAHVEGFAKECAVVTHHRLEEKEGKLIPAGPLEEPLVVRPTSETIIGEAFSRWIQSYRDLPLLINQWANVVRFEMRTRLFLRTTEFLWQEGHTAHATEKEAIEETEKMLDIYEDFAKKRLALPVIKGEKSAYERFPGANNTYTIECMTQDRRALQAGTSHFLGQNFAKASEIRFQTEKGEEQYAWTTSWGVTTRLIGALVMSHSDDDGLVLPPHVAPLHIVLIPILHDKEKADVVKNYIEKIKKELDKKSFGNLPLRIEIDEREMRGGEKSWSWIKKGVPLRVEIGPRDMDQGKLVFYRRDRGPKEMETLPWETFVDNVENILEEIQESIYQKAFRFREENSIEVTTKEQFYAQFKAEKSPGFVFTYFSTQEGIEKELQQELGVTVRCIPLEEEKREGVCIFTGKPHCKRVIFAKAY